MKPESLTLLDAESAVHIAALMLAATSGMRLARGLFAHMPMLWVLDEAGNIFIAFEEIVTSDTYRFLRPRSRRDNMIDNEARLGHPALVGDDCSARIGGELSYDPGWGQQHEGWYISNASGRFGIDVGLGNTHLRNVCDVFESFGIDVRPVFY